MTNTDSPSRSGENQPVPSSGSKSRWSQFAIIAALAIPVLLYFGLGGCMAGEEFSPDDFSRRRFSYNQMPLFKINLWGIGYDDTTPVFEQSLLSDGYLGNAPPIKKWDLVADTWTSELSPDLDAGLLCNVLDIKNHHNDCIWYSFNEDHSELADVFWPIIADMARRGLYIEASQLMLRGIGLQEEDREDYLSDIHQTSTLAFNRLANEKFANGEFESAVDIYTVSLEIIPTKDGYLGRSKCYQELGDNQKSESDELAAQKFSDQ